MKKEKKKVAETEALEVETPVEKKDNQPEAKDEKNKPETDKKVEDIKLQTKEEQKKTESKEKSRRKKKGKKSSTPVSEGKEEEPIKEEKELEKIVDAQTDGGNELLCEKGEELIELLKKNGFYVVKQHHLKEDWCQNQYIKINLGTWLSTEKIKQLVEVIKNY